MTFEWARPDLNPRFVHVWHERQDLYLNQHPSYKGRTSVSVNQLKHGDVSLTLHKVKLSDEGTYRCYFPDSDKDSTVQLVVGVSSSPFVSLSGIDRSSSGVVLDCESRGWYPEPEVLWLDAEGNLLSAGPTETVRGPDDLYTVSSRVTVEKRHSNSFTCRVQQKNTNQTRETHITVPDDFFVAPCSSVVCISLVVSFTCVLAVVFAVWRWRRNKNKTMMDDQRERQQLMAESEKRKEKEHGDMVGALMKQEEELKKQRDRLKGQQEKMERLVGDNEMKLEKRELDQLELDTEKLLVMTKSVIDEVTDRKTTTQNHMEEENK
ncbi:butyrophilin subfamily 2 member A2-like [Anoplopoma fimbria]|uniref:butyrophilin subfamily 2 member A2-like n=1 Tax=Anoplopoma fimbria TaxID=229290 RepID=UPI0023ECF2DE|nr:butyrophilin subfamily 2 member A2-like [Anoplopoma fimbria]